MRGFFGWLGFGLAARFALLSVLCGAPINLCLGHGDDRFRKGTKAVCFGFWSHLVYGLFCAVEDSGEFADIKNSWLNVKAKTLSISSRLRLRGANCHWFSKLRTVNLSNVESETSESTGRFLQKEPPLHCLVGGYISLFKPARQRVGKIQWRHLSKCFASEIKLSKSDIYYCYRLKVVGVLYPLVYPIGVLCCGMAILFH